MRLMQRRWNYFIHFLQWNRKWDRWFEADGLKCIDDAQVEAAAAEARKSNMGVATEVSAEEAAAAQSLKEEEQNRKRRRKTLAAQELVRDCCIAVVLCACSRSVRWMQCEEDAATYSKLPIPFTLKKLLVDEWEVSKESTINRSSNSVLLTVSCCPFTRRLLRKHRTGSLSCPERCV